MNENKLTMKYKLGTLILTKNILITNSMSTKR